VFGNLLCKIIPYQISANVLANSTVTFNITPVTSNNFVSPEEASKNIEMLPAILDIKPNAAISDAQLADAELIEVGDDEAASSDPNSDVNVHLQQSETGDPQSDDTDPKPDPADDGKVLLIKSKRRKPPEYGLFGD